MSLTLFKRFPPEPVPEGVTLLFLIHEQWWPVTIHDNCLQTITGRYYEYGEPFVVGVLRDGTVTTGKLCAIDTQGRDRPDVFIPESPTDEQVVELMGALGFEWQDCRGYSHLDAKFCNAATRFAQLGACRPRGWVLVGENAAELAVGPETGEEGKRAASEAVLRHVRGMYK